MNQKTKYFANEKPRNGERISFDTLSNKSVFVGGTYLENFYLNDNYIGDCCVDIRQRYFTNIYKWRIT